jgi:DNA-binding transcriptional regulator YhcF (GntR family)
MPKQNDPLVFSAERPKQVYQQVRDHVRQMIMEGLLPAESKLPSTKELAAKWSVPPATVQTALTQLVREGLLIRIRKKGTFVLDRNTKLKRIGAYYDSSIWSNESSTFKQAVHLELLRLCEAKGMRLEAFFDTRQPAQRTTPLPELISAVEKRQVQALIATDIAANEASWLGRLPIPTAVFVEAHHPFKVDFDFDQFLDLGIRELKAAECESVGIISLRGPWKPGVGSGATSRAQPDFAEIFSNLAQKYGLKTLDRWIRPAADFVQGQAQQEFGYDQFLKLWEQPSHPDGLIVYPNTCSAGVITAVLEKRIDVPANLKLVLHKHFEIDYLCPLSASFLCTSVADAAKALLHQVVSEFQGKDRSQIILPFTVASKRSSLSRARALSQR